MPGKQMAIDADLNAGLIDEDEARRRRAEVSAEADFYGAMDGASKFVKGDAIAAIVITIVNLFGGFVVGVVQRHHVDRRRHLDVQPADHRRRPGLPDPRPAHLDLHRPDRHPRHHRRRHGQRPAQAVRRAAPRGADRRQRDHRAGHDPRPAQAAVPAGRRRGAGHRPAPAQAGRRVEGDPGGGGRARRRTVPGHARSRSPGDMRVEPLELELAYDLVDLVDASTGGDLLDRVRALRRKLALELGIVIPPVRTRDNLDLPPSTYAIRLHGVEVARGEAPAGMLLAIGDDLGVAAGHGHQGAGLRPGRQVGAGRDAPARRAWPAPPWWTAPRWSPPTWPRSCAATPPSCSAARTSRRSSTWSRPPTRSSSRS